MLRWEAPALSVALFAFASGAAAQGTHDALIAKHAAANNLPEALVRRVIRIESRGNPRVVANGNYGLMQIRLGTARAMGYRGGPEGLLDPDTNMTYAVKYLAGAYRRAGCNPDRAIANYQKGYRHAAGSKCLTPQPEQTQVAGAQNGSKSASDRRAKVKQGMVLAQSQSRLVQMAPVQSNDVLKPKVVPTLSIPRLDPEPAPRQVAPSPPVPAPRPRATSPEAPAQEPAATRAHANSGTDAVPVPRVKKTGARSARSVAPAKDLLAAAPSTREAAPTRRKHARKKTGTPLDLIGFLKKLVTPDKKTKSRKHRSRTQRQALR